MPDTVAGGWKRLSSNDMASMVRTSASTKRFSLASARRLDASFRSRDRRQRKAQPTSPICTCMTKPPTRRVSCTSPAFYRSVIDWAQNLHRAGKSITW